MKSQLSDKQIQAQIAAIRRASKNVAPHYAIRFSGNWLGAKSLVVDGIEHLVFPCISDLQVRESLLQAETEGKPAVLLCAVGDEALGQDVRDRLAKRCVFAPQVREMVAEMFSVSPTQIDPRVFKSKALMEALMDHVPSGGYLPVASGTLDLQTAWLTLLGGLMGERVEMPSLARFLEWSLVDRKLAPLAEMGAELKGVFVDWFARSRGEAIRFMMAAIDAGYGSDLAAIGAAMGLVFDSEHSGKPEHQTARGRLERFVQHRKIDAESASAWFRASDAVLSRLKDDVKGSARRSILNRLDELLDELGLANHAWLSNLSPRGLEQRYQHASQALLKGLTAKSASGRDALRGALTMIRRHLLGAADPERYSRLEMACRLVSWLHADRSPAAPEKFDALAVRYHREGGFIDWARNRLKETDESPEVQKAFRAILKLVDAQAEAFEMNFGQQLQEWTKSESRSERILYIEDMLEGVVRPTAKQQPVLLLVLDGMSVAVFRQLLHDVLQHEWTEIICPKAAIPRPVIASLPSITMISRRALFLGRLDPAVNGTEEGEFKANDLLFHGSGSQTRPQLFKMGDLSDEVHGGFASEVREAIGDKKCRVVSVVLNAIDDHLDSGKQVDFVWTRNTIRGFRDLLRQASDAGRLIIMTSDHGHVLDFGTKQLPSPKEGRGDRYRAADGKPQPGELEFEGSRIYKATGHNRVTLACSANVRYTKGKRGYHGGANPQEIVAPLAILSDVRADVPEGWTEVAPFEPDWWKIDTSEVRPAFVAKAKTEKAVQGLELFEMATQPVGSEGGWIGALLKSPTYQEQSKLAVRGARNEELMIRLLKILDSRGGTVVKQALAQELDMPPFRVDGLIINVSRILNIDGYEVIGFDRASDTVTLNLGLLRTQFDLKN